MDPAQRSQLAGMQAFLLAVTVCQPLLYVASNVQAPDRFDPWIGKFAMTALSGLAWWATVRLPWARERAKDVALAVAFALQTYILCIGAANDMSVEVVLGIVMTTAVMVTLCRTLPHVGGFALLTVGGAALANELAGSPHYATSTVATVLGAVIAAVGIMLQQRGRLERQLADALQDVQRLDATKSRVLHDLANVASRLVGSCDELEEQLPAVIPRLPPDVGEALADEVLQLRRAVDYIVDLHTNVRGLHRDGAGTLQPQNVSRSVQGAVSIARQELPPITTIQVACSPTSTVRCDPTDLGRILVNLLINAGHAMGEAGTTSPTLTVTSRDHADEVEIRVEDNGPGIPAPLRQRIFEPRFTTREDVGGTGLGLAISRELAIQNGGSLELDVGHVGGAAFVVRLPAGPTAPRAPRRSA